MCSIRKTYVRQILKNLDFQIIIDDQKESFCIPN